jgi:hypothetical protein
VWEEVDELLASKLHLVINTAKYQYLCLEKK